MIFIVMKILITEQQLNELFSQSLVQKLIDKFRKEKPNLDEKIIRYYIKRFQEIKDSPKVKYKDINTYSWKDLEILVDENQPRDYDKSIKISDSDLIYNQNNLRIYRANTKRACIAYGNGYSFCISARSENNMYTEYRFASDYTIYFVFDDDRTRETLPNGKFKDPYHLIVLMVKSLDDNEHYNEGSKDYKITTANNDGENNTDNWYKIAKIQPKLLNLQNIFTVENPDKYEQLEYELEKETRKKLQQLALSYPSYLFKSPDDTKFGYIYDVTLYDAVNQIYDGKRPILYDGYNSDNQLMISQPRLDDIDKDKWMEIMNKETDSLDEDDEYHLTYVKTRELKFSPEYIHYLAKASDIISEYLNGKNKLRAQFS